jgi:hypothetical protein
MIKISEDTTMTENVHTYGNTIDVIVNRVKGSSLMSNAYTSALHASIVMSYINAIKSSLIE